MAVAAVVLVGLARLWEPRSLLALAPLGALWAASAAAAVWQFGLAPAERARLGRELRRGPAKAAVVET
jgi:hypothetical protein